MPSRRAFARIPFMGRFRAAEMRTADAPASAILISRASCSSVQLVLIMRGMSYSTNFLSLLVASHQQRRAIFPSACSSELTLSWVTRFAVDPAESLFAEAIHSSACPATALTKIFAVGCHADPNGDKRIVRVLRLDSEPFISIARRNKTTAPGKRGATVTRS